MEVGLDRKRGEEVEKGGMVDGEPFGKVIGP